MLASTLAVSAAIPSVAHGAKRISSRGAVKMNNPDRIDVHQHLLPPEFVAALDKHGMGAWAIAPWSEDGALAMMDKTGIRTGILSLSTPGPHLGNDAEARVLARDINEYQATLVQKRPDRFGMFACLPLPDIDGTLDAIRHAYDALSTDGVIILASNKGVYVGDPAFDPIMEELNRRHAVILIHPGPLPGPPIPGIHPAIADFLLDTTRAAINLAQNGIPRRFPNLRIILSHAGGFMPYAAERIAINVHVTNPKIETEDVLANLASFYFDTAMSGSPTTLPGLLKFARPGRVMFGSDAPYCSQQTITHFTDGLDAYEPGARDLHHAINRGNAEALFPRLAVKAASRTAR